MIKFFKIIFVCLVFLIVIFSIFGCNKEQADVAKPEPYEWVTVDEFYIPLDYVEEFIKKDSAEKGLLPIQIINYGSDAAMLRMFKGMNFAGPTESQLKMMYNGLGEWKLIDLKYKTEKDKEIQRTILYVYVNGEWMVGDSGKLIQ